MNAMTRSPIHQFRAVLLPNGYRHDDLVDSGGRALTLMSSQGSFEAWTWIHDLPCASDDDRLQVGDVCTLTLGAQTASSLVLTRFIPAPTDCALHYVPATACPVAGEVDNVRSLVVSIHNPEIRRFVQDALSISAAFRWFWTCPASIASHHAYPGGLARHSREVAERAARAVGDNPLQCDISIAYGLLHDFGKLWSYESGHLTRAAQHLGHEHLGFEKLMPVILQLRERWDEGGYIMQSLLSGNWKRDGHAPIVAVGNVVRSLDQFSAEGDQGKRYAARERIDARRSIVFQPRRI